MTFAVVIDGTISHEIAWDGDAASLREKIRERVTRSEVSTLRLASGSSVLVNWRAVKTVEVREA